MKTWIRRTLYGIFGACVTCADDGEYGGDDAGSGETCGECSSIHREDCYAEGAACEHGGDCCSSYCNAEGQCEPGDDPDVCQDPGASCSADGDCCEGTCDATGSCTGGVCTQVPTADGRAVPCEVEDTDTQAGTPFELP